MLDRHVERMHAVNRSWGPVTVSACSEVWNVGVTFIDTLSSQHFRQDGFWESRQLFDLRIRRLDEGMRMGTKQ